MKKKKLNFLKKDKKTTMKMKPQVRKQTNRISKIDKKNVYSAKNRGRVEQPSDIEDEDEDENPDETYGEFPNRKLKKKQKNGYPFEDDEDSEDIEDPDAIEDNEKDDINLPYGSDENEDDLNTMKGQSPFIDLNPSIDLHDPYSNEDKPDKKAKFQNKKAFKQVENIIQDMSKMITERIIGEMLRGRK